MKRASAPRRRLAVHITLSRASRLHHLVTILATGGHTREELLGTVSIGLRTFYRELELLKRCGVKIRLAKKLYVLFGTAEEAEGRLPFPDPQLSFAEMAELARGPGDAARRLAELLATVIQHPPAVPAKRKKSRGKGKSR
jgi:hypothetical protein